MARHAHEFQCDGRQPGREAVPEGQPVPGGDNCGWYNYPMLDEKMNGNYIIICGHCGHEHHRQIKNGVVTGDRITIDGKDGTAERIHVMPSACQPTKRKLGAIAQFRQMEAAGLAK